MSTYIRPTAQQSQYVSGIPLDAIIQVGSYKESRYNAVKSTIQDSLNIPGLNNLIKDSDIEYVNQKMGSLVENLNKSSGLDFSDPTVENDLMSQINSSVSDPNISRIIRDNKKASKEINKLYELKDKNSELYNPANEIAFQQNMQAWMNDTTGRVQPPTYTPYTDTSFTDILEIAAKNPDIDYVPIFQDIQRPDGTIERMQIGEREVKALRADKLTNIMLQNMTSAQRNQFALEYGLDIQNMTSRDLANMHSRRVEDFNNLINSRKNILTESGISNIENDPKIKEWNNAILKANQRYNNALSSGDVQQYYSLNDFIEGRVYGTASNYSFEQRGSIKESQWNSDRFKHSEQIQLQNMREAAAWNRAVLSAETSKSKSLNSVDVANSTGLPGSATYAYAYAPMKDIKEALFEGKNSFTLSGEYLSDMFNSQREKDGTYSVNLQGKQSYIDVVDQLSQKANIEKDKAEVLIDLNNKFNIWLGKKAKEKSTVIGKIAGTFLPFLSPITGSAFEDPEVNETLSDFSKTKEGKDLLEKTSKTLGFDLTSSSQGKRLQEVISKSPDLLAALQYGTLLNDAKGQINFIPQEQDQMKFSDDGNLYVKGKALIKRNELMNMLYTKDKKEGEKRFKNLIDQGLITLASEAKDQKDDIMQFNLTMKTDLTLDQAKDKWMNREYTSSKENSESKPLALKQFNLDNNQIKSLINLKNSGDLRFDENGNLYGKLLADVNTITITQSIKGGTLENFSPKQKETINQVLQASLAVVKDSNKDKSQRIFVASKLRETIDKINTKGITYSELLGSDTSNLPKSYEGNSMANDVVINMKKYMPELSPAGLAGIIGNITQETGHNIKNLGAHYIDPKAKGSSTAKGLVGWLNDRYNPVKKAVEQQGLSMDSVEGQVYGIMWELKKDYPKLYQELMTINDPELAAERFHDVFERSSDRTDKGGVNFRKRKEYANNFYPTFRTL